MWIPITGTSFTGDVAGKTGAGYVRGKRVQTAVIAELLAHAHHGMDRATNIILTGG